MTIVVERRTKPNKTNKTFLCVGGWGGGGGCKSGLNVTCPYD